MQRLLLILVILLIPMLVFAKGFYPEADVDLEEELFWTRIYFKPKSHTAVMNFRIWFKHPPQKVWKALTDTASFKAEMNNYNEAKTLTRTLFKKIVDANPKSYREAEKIIGPNQLASNHNRRPRKNWTDYIYFRFNFPWPLTDRWAAQKFKCDETNYRKGQYKIDYKAHAGNFKELIGHWKLKPIPGHSGWTEWQGRYESNAGVAVPKFITKKAMKSGLKKDTETYRKILAR